jgi:amino acid adenylation domain-containing protein
MTQESAARIHELSPAQKRELLRSLLVRERGASEPPGSSSAPSHGQRGLWFIQQLDADSCAYNMAWPARIESALDAGALHRAFIRLVERHPALRTLFVQDGDGVRLETPQRWDSLLQFRSHDASGWSEAAVQDAVTAAYRVPFQLQTGPTLRVDLFTTAPDRHVLLVVAHHIAVDGWSMTVLLRDLGALYTAERTGGRAALPALPWTMQDHVAWQRRMLDGPAGAALWQRWRERLSGELPVLELSPGAPRTRQRAGGRSAAFALDAELSAAVRRLARQQGCTVYVVLLAAYCVLLARGTRSDDLVIGTPMAGRSRDELRDMIGYFVNLVPLRARVSPGLTFAGLLAQLRDTVLAAMDDQDLPFDLLVERLRPERDASRGPLVEALFEYRQLQHEGELVWLTVTEDDPQRFAIGELACVGRYPLVQQEGKFDLQLEMADLSDAIAGVWKYRPAIISDDRIAGMTRHLSVLLRAAVARPDAAVDALPIMDDDERRQMLQLSRARTRVDAPHRLHRWFEAQAAAEPDAIAVVDGLDQLSYGELNRRANQIAHELRARGVVPGQLVGLCVERSAAIVIGQLAILKAGAAYLPLDPELPADRLALYVRDADIAVALGDAATQGRLALPGPGMLALDGLGRGRPEDNLDLDVEIDRDAPAYVIYTSGSTGRPKGVVISHHNVARLLVATQPRFGFGPRDVWTLFHSYAFDFSVWEIWGALLHGGRLVVVPRAATRSPELLHALLCSEGVTVLNQTPGAFRELSQIDELAGSGAVLALRVVIFGGEALAPGSLAGWVQRHGDRPRLVNMYGITETCVHVSYRELSQGDVLHATSSPIGGAIDDLSLYVLDDHMALVPAGVPGEIYVGGPGLAHGYLGRPGTTAERFVPDPFGTEPGQRLYRTGDLARRVPGSDDVEYLGRIDSQVKIRGFRIELGEIEHALRSQPAVRDAVVVVDRQADGDQLLIAYVVPRREAVATSDAELTAALRDALAARLPAYMVPAAIVATERLPLNHNGKLDRKLLPAWRTARAADNYEPPRSELERRLAAIWTELLPVERVGRGDRFFHIGGHSLLATRLILRVRHELAVELPILEIFEHPMLAEFAARVAAALPDAPPDAPADAIARVDRSAAAPLGLAQHRLWFLDRLDAGNPVYNVPMQFRLSGRLDRDALARSLETIAARHEVLRTSFPVVAGQPVQRIAPPADFALSVVDLRELAPDVAEARAHEIATAAYHEPFDLGAGPLWRGQLLILGDDEHWLVLCAHHAVLDGWSVNLYLGELTALYLAAVTGAAPVLPALDVQYVDFSEWQRHRLAGDALRPQIEYWKAQLADAPTVLEIPGDRPRPPVQRFRGGMVPFALTAQQTRAVRRLALDEQATPFIVLLAAFQALLHRWTGQRDLLVGSPVAGRPRREVEHLLGCFVNNLVFRARFDAVPAFRALLRATRSDALGAYEHQDLPFEVLVDVLAVERDLSRNPVFQVMFALQNTPRSALEIPGLRMASVMPDSRIAKFDLSLNLTEDAAGFTGFFEYNSELYDRQTIEGLAGSFAALLDHALGDPDCPVDRLDVLSDAQRRRVLEAWNPARDTAPPRRTIGEQFTAQLAARGAERCLITRRGALSYAEVAARAGEVARWLVREGTGPGIRVGICMDRTAELPIAMLGVLLAGGACVPMDPKYPRDRLAFMAADSGAALVIADARGSDVLSGWAGRVVSADDVARPAGDAVPSVELPRGASDDLAYVIYTSGSTGRPKGVALSHRGVAALVAWSTRVYSDDDLAGVLASTSVCFDLSIFELFVTWSRGGAVVLVEDLLELQASPLAGEVRLINTVPSAMTELLRMNAVPATARIINLAGEPIRQALVDGLYALGSVRDVYNLYGPTEDTVYSTFARLERHAEGSPPIGVAIDHGRAYVLDDHMAPVPIGVAGELYLGGEGLADGYLNQPALTAQRFVPDPFSDPVGAPGARLYRTGDLARWRSNGQLEFLGRNDGQVKLRGYRIELGEIEEALARHPRVREAAVLVRSDAALGPRLVAYVATGDGERCEPAALRDHLAATLPSYMVPASYVIQAALPHTPNGKIDRRALPAIEPAPAPPRAHHAAPATAIEDQVLATWRRVLARPEVGVDDNFFDLGGHSLLMTQVHVLLEDQFPGRARLSELFQYPTVRLLAAFLAGGDHPAGGDDQHGRERAALRKRQRQSRRAGRGGGA